MEKKTLVLKCPKCSKVTAAIQNIPPEKFICHSCKTNHDATVGMVDYDKDKHTILNIDEYWDGKN